MSPKPEERRAEDPSARLVNYQVDAILREFPSAHRDGIGLVSREDMRQFGHLGWLEAQQRFDPRRGVRFETFAQHRVRGAIFDGLRKMGVLKRRRLEALRRMDRAHQLLGEPQPEAAEPSRADDAAAVAGAIAHLALDHLLEGVLGEPPPSPEEATLTAETRGRVQAALSHLSDSDKEILEAVYDVEERGDSGAELARARGVSRSKISRRHLRILERLRRQLE